MTAPMPKVPLPDRPLLTPGEVAHALAVDPRTVIRWGQEGTLNFVRLPARDGLPGHRRYFRSEIDDLINGPEAGK